MPEIIRSWHLEQNIRIIPPQREQGGHDSCSYMAVCSAIEARKMLERARAGYVEVTEQLSPQFVIDKLVPRTLDGFVQRGTNISHYPNVVLRFIKNEGTCYERLHPYVGTPTEAPVVLDDRDKVRPLRDFYDINASESTRIAQEIFEKGPVVGCFALGDAPTRQGFHSMMMIGTLSFEGHVSRYVCKDSNLDPHDPTDTGIRYVDKARLVTCYVPLLDENANW